MKTIVVVSGKGGVGKSSITASLGVLLSKAGVSLTAVDADVDAPNLSIVLGSEISDFVAVESSEKASIDLDKCISCGKCISSCEPQALIDQGDGSPLLIPFLCEGCGACAIVCPVDAASISRVANGCIGTSRSSHGFPVVVGQLQIGESNSGELVTLVKSKGAEIADRDGCETLLVDGPPGIGCPVIAVLTGADYVIAVTEPTPIAANSLGRLLDVAAHFDIPAGVVINKFSLDQEYAKDMENWLQRERQIPVLQRIPMDDNFPLSLADRTPLPVFNPACEGAEALRQLSTSIIAELSKIGDRGGS